MSTPPSTPAPPYGYCKRNKPVWALNPAGFPICGAITSRNNEEPYSVCDSRFRMPNGRCRVHGGASQPAGSDNVNFRDGSRSSKMPTRLDVAYNRIRQDPELLSVQKDVAVAEVHLEELGYQLENGFDSNMINFVINSCEELQNILDSPAGAEMVLPEHFLVCLCQLIDRVADGNDTSEIWRTIHSVTNHKAHLIKTEQQILQAQKLTITADQAKMLVRAIVSCMLMEADNFKGAVLHELDNDHTWEAKQLLRGSNLNRNISNKVKVLTSSPDILEIS